MMRVIVCGGRDFDDYERLASALNRAHARKPIIHVIHGAAPGADLLAERWAKENWIPYTGVPAERKKHGDKADHLQMTEIITTMLHDAMPDAVIAMPGGKGTAMMCELAHKAGVKVWQPYG